MRDHSFRAASARVVRRFRAKAPLLTMVSMIGGCAGPMGPIRSNPPPPPPVTSFDGTYHTTIRPAGSFGSAQLTSWCDTPGQPNVTVANGQFTYAAPHPNVPGNPTPVYSATMAEDGSFYGQIVAGTISGQVQGSRMEGRIDGSACVYAFTGYRL
jgi:hypothetical protein